MNSTTSRSSSFASSQPATSPQRTELDDEGAISVGFVRGMYWTIQTTATAMRPMKMIGSQVRAKLSMSPQNDPPEAAGSSSSGSNSSRTASVPSLRESTLRGGVEDPALGQIGARCPQRVPDRVARLTAVELRRVEHRELVWAPVQAQLAELLVAGDLERDRAGGRATGRGGERRPGRGQRDQDGQHGQAAEGSPHSVPQSAIRGISMSPN